MAMINLLSKEGRTMAELGVRELSEQVDGPLLQIAGQTQPDGRQGERRFG
jgi:hypothetical protein